MGAIHAAGTTTHRVAGLDLLRGIAVGLVLLRHAFPTAFPGAGVVGVVMFFALSGWLITGLLHDELTRTGRVDLRAFYLRRARRLVPALLALVLGVVVVTLALDPLGDRDQLRDTVLVALTWTADLPIGDPSDATFHLWTLAVEEQFYLVWPLAVLLMWRRPRLLVVLAGTACLVACVATVLWLRDAPDAAYALPTSWAGCFVIGAAGRLLPLPALRASARRRVAGVALAALVALSVVPLRGHALTYLAGGPAIAILTMAAVHAWRDGQPIPAGDGGPARRRAPLTLLVAAGVWLGTVSYAAYLWNYPLTMWLRPHLSDVGGVALAGPVALALTLLLAAASDRWVERPWRSAPTASSLPAPALGRVGS
ncbi:acyltransferase [Nocardioides sp. R-C-SC26]|uniref:acyltransferase family protein n=1 Tax=Nocardioides sp. R-C-SC26 TaxID=2870414 RepID=UPI001E42632A|nr:acyltransferase [Nocardioides sp. R-C-SC26]